MKKILSLTLMFLLCLAGAMAKSDKMPQYEITGAGSGTEGTLLVKVFVYEKNVSDADYIRAAVHGVVFRGIASGNASGARQPAMAPITAETDNATFCKEFFTEKGQCQSFGTIISGSYDRVKTQKGYKCGAIVQVDKTALRKTLEQAGVVRSLSSGF